MNPDPYSLKKPCANCPFNKVGAIELMPGRVEGIIKDLLNGKATGFSCHKTVYKNRSCSKREKENHKQCAGSLILLEKMGRQTQLMQVMERLGLYHPDDLKPYHDQVIDVPELVLEGHYRVKSVTIKPATQD